MDRPKKVTVEILTQRYKEYGIPALIDIAIANGASERQLQFVNKDRRKLSFLVWKCLKNTGNKMPKIQKPSLFDILPTDILGEVSKHLRSDKDFVNLMKTSKYGQRHRHVRRISKPININEIIKGYTYDHIIMQFPADLDKLLSLNYAPESLFITVKGYIDISQLPRIKKLIISDKTATQHQLLDFRNHPQLTHLSVRGNIRMLDVNNNRNLTHLEIISDKYDGGENGIDFDALPKLEYLRLHSSEYRHNFKLKNTKLKTLLIICPSKKLELPKTIETLGADLTYDNYATTIAKLKSEQVPYLKHLMINLPGNNNTIPILSSVKKLEIRGGNINQQIDIRKHNDLEQIVLDMEANTVKLPTNIKKITLGHRFDVDAEISVSLGTKIIKVPKLYDIDQIGNFDKFKSRGGKLIEYVDSDKPQIFTNDFVAKI